MNPKIRGVVKAVYVLVTLALLVGGTVLLFYLMRYFNTIFHQSGKGHGLFTQGYESIVITLLLGYGLCAAGGVWGMGWLFRLHTTTE